MTTSQLSRLATHLGVDLDAAAQALEELTAHLRDQLRQQGTLTLPDVGTFWTEQGQLHFEPASSLVLAANGRYFGMEAFEVAAPEAPPPPVVPLPAAPAVDSPPEPEFWEAAPAPESPLGPYTPPVLEEADFTLDALPPEPEPVSNAFLPPPPAEEGFSLLPEPEAPAPPEFVPTAPLPAEVADVLPEAPPQTWVEQTPALPFPFDPSPAPEPPAPEPLTALPPQRSPDRPSYPATRVEAGTSPALMAGLVVLALIGGALFAYWWFNRTPAVEPPEVSLQTLPSDTTRTDTLAATGSETPADPAAAAAEAPPPVEETPPASEAPVPATETPAPATTRLTSGYTVVIGSEPTEALARTRAGRYQNLGYPVDVLAGTAGGQRRYRVALGSFASQSEAEAARRQLSGQIPGDAWVMVIR